MKKAILFLLALFLVVGPAFSAHGQTSAEPPHDDGVQRPAPPPAGAMIGDFVFVRPLCLVATAIGVVGTVALLPISVPSGSVHAVAQKLVAEPFAFTFTRPLGTFPVSTEIWP